MKDFSYITNSHPAFIESLYQEFVKNPAGIDQDLRKFFEGFDFAVANHAGAAVNGQTAVAATAAIDWMKEIRVYRLILGYRNKGHLLAKTNPIRPRKDRGANLELSFFGLSDADLDTVYQAGNLIGLGATSLRNILDHLQKCYADKVGIEFKYISDQKKIDWLTNEMERKFNTPVPITQKKRILEKLNQGVMFEKFLHTKYIGQKRFSLEGGETTIAALDAIINVAGNNDVQEVVIGMAHRGRLNVLANVMGKTYEQIFSEFEGTADIDQTMGSGDVKYHMGYGSEVQTADDKHIHLKLMPNPSHLEAVDPVVVGFARAKADVLYGSDFDRILPILVHGDASVAGQGIVYEVLQMSNLAGYYTGGTIHFVINNQIGFTTDFDDARSADYCTSAAAMIQAPVLHVNGDDAEAAVKCAEIATRYRQEFNSDIFIDMVCYRKHGHNEGDDPKYTQPQLYALIDKHPNPREIYTQYLMENGEADAQQLAKEMEKKFWADLQERLDEVKQHPLPYKYQQPELVWKSLRKATEEDFVASPATSISEEEVRSLFNGLMKWPSDFQPLKKVEKLLQDKIKLLETEQKIDWATAELMAYGSILCEGNIVRMSGQDVKRGTFSHRHAVLRDENTNAEYNRLDHLQEKQAAFRIYNSLLSEYGVLGFEYGYAMANPNALVIWEAQFGDFCNGAQTLIDQFIAAGEQKWQRQNGVVMLLPHGYEGQGPEHSSARMERFLQMCAELNLVVTNITSSSNLFHAFRRQLTWPFRKPLINFSPKANLRNPGTYSPVSEFTTGGFRELIDDAFVKDATQVKKVLLCSGKLYFELADKQQKDNRNDIAIVRLEQLYPLPYRQIDALYKKYSKATWFWVQEEPLNMGAASFLQMNLKNINFGVISRNASAATATGYAKVHAQEQSEIIDTAFGI
ncbi:2-oxoglutarate dehydrogenase E1 component [Hydrobacter penzbergensis]|jgi:2-oxoglutarate dehydrogenase E1 component|uniref:oxoglutarate dehydrogenase (succinyl-transferring) n=1 Tax=Hydrobacter penzbergensis TaxID=1235997 RepID=A0A8X8LH66_9BACT|nr:2-oxoglutarate dehydrogenase E1 component [Hydrobacter penzbergensis]MBN8720824.1 2-oxoglutarate dehydrogenase E1 component [Sediminibacterium magnilacihabitans]PQV58171.1 2-oxoglutarate dehydrogenase E1 component [Sediminibacterium magnilacihabitans]SDX61525.1 2-oxoglutarate dehydrogenase E1 component [Hydrobacter penzbergensis]